MGRRRVSGEAKCGASVLPQCNGRLEIVSKLPLIGMKALDQAMKSVVGRPGIDGVHVSLPIGLRSGERHDLGARGGVERERLEDLADVRVGPDQACDPVNVVQRHRLGDDVQVDVQVEAGQREAGVALIQEFVGWDGQGDDHRVEVLPRDELTHNVAFLVEPELILGGRDMEGHQDILRAARDDRQRHVDIGRSIVDSDEVPARDASQGEAVAAIDHRLRVVRGAGY